LDAASESEDNTVGINPGKMNQNTSKKTYLHSVATIQLFIYLFIPILKSLKREDLDTLKLSNGLKIWEPLWAYSQPDIKIFTSPVRKNKNPSEKKVLIPELQEETYMSREVSLKKKEEKSPIKMSIKLKHKLSIIADKIYDKKPEIQEVDETKFFEDSKKANKASEKMIVESKNEKKPLMPKSSSCMEKLGNKGTEECFKQDNKTKRSESTLTKPLFLKKSQSDLDRIFCTEEEDHSFGISEIDNEVISDSLFSINEKNNNLKESGRKNAPLAHMNSICLSEKSINSSNTLTKEAPRRISKDTNTSVETNKLNEKSYCCVCQEKISKEADKCDKCLLNSQIIRSSFAKASTIDQFDGLNEKLQSFDTNEKIIQSILDATYFDIGVMRCLLSPKWNTEGYLWSLEYLSHRVLEITDHILKEQDKLFKFKCPSMPSNLNNLFEMMGVGTGNEFDEDLISIDNQFNCKNSNAYYTNQFIELVNQIYFENDQTNNNYMLKNANDYSKRRKYEASFQTRIR
jgi:hypothetical protein